MQTPKRHLTRHRRQRYILWALAMLQWIAAVFAGKTITTRLAHQRGDVSLRGLTRMVLQLAIIRAGDLARLRRRPLTFFKRGRDLRRAHLLRAVVGSHLRRKLKHKHLSQRIAILVAVLRDLDSFATPLGRRLRRGFTRLFPITTTATLVEAILGAPAPALAFSDSS